MIQSDFVISAVSERDFPKEGIPEIVFAGRSNVGKSSLINRLTGSKKLARTGSVPGKTQSINFYRINRSFFFVDLPGFGYAKVGKDKTRRWERLIANYFQNRTTVALVIHLVDSRIPPTDMDRRLTEWLERLNIPRLIAATKSDKLSNNKMISQLRIISDSLGEPSIVMSSAETGMGCREIWKQILKAAAIVTSPGEQQ
ncbi:MAG TPA: ribosome biogenesis GTP-binding protein YihA/YsxC [Acidobacteriota bacterium]|nr:ribosome biogenesis GTP-binding protein YihA/YsxC [Acidobacteriota bacterium]